jgi:hypothetical protein
MRSGRILNAASVPAPAGNPKALNRLGKQILNGISDALSLLQKATVRWLAGSRISALGVGALLNLG